MALLDNVRAQSVSVTYKPPSSLFRPDSYTLLLDLIEAADGPLAAIVRSTRRLLFGASRQPLPVEEEAQDGWSILRFLSKLTGSRHTLLGDYYSSEQSQAEAQASRTKRILDNLSAGAPLSKAEVRLSLDNVDHMLSQAGQLGYDPAWPLVAELNFWGKHGKQQNLSNAYNAYSTWAARTGDPEAQYMVGFLQGTGLGDDGLQETDQASVSPRAPFETRQADTVKGSPPLHLRSVGRLTSGRDDHRISTLGRDRHTSVMRRCIAVLQVCCRQSYTALPLRSTGWPPRPT